METATAMPTTKPAKPKKPRSQSPAERLLVIWWGVGNDHYADDRDYWHTTAQNCYGARSLAQMLNRPKDAELFGQGYELANMRARAGKARA